MTIHVDAINSRTRTRRERSGLSSGQIRVAANLADFSDLWPRSDRPGDARCHAFQCADLLEVWLATIGVARKIEPLFVVVNDATGKPWLALPLGIERRFGTRVLTFLDGGVSDYNAPVVLSQQNGFAPVSLRDLVERLHDMVPSFDIAVFEKMPAEVIDAPNPLVGPELSTHLPFGHAMSLSGSWNESSRARLPRGQDSRRKRRKLEALGRLEFVVAQDARDSERLLQAMIEQKSHRYIETRGFDGFDRPGYRTYYPKMTGRLGAAVHLSALLLDDRILATHWGLVAGSRFYFLMTGYDHEWSQFSPGRLLIEHLIEWSCRNGLSCFDFGVGDESYKSEYCDRTLSLHRAFIPVTARGSLYLAAFHCKSRLKRMRTLRWLHHSRQTPEPTSAG